MFYYTGHSVQYNFINIIRHHTIKDHQTVFALIVYKKKTYSSRYNTKLKTLILEKRIVITYLENPFVL